MSATKNRSSQAQSNETPQGLRVSEVTVWAAVLAVLVVVRSVTPDIFSDDTVWWLGSLIICFALIYYTIISHYFNVHQRRYIKDIADVIIIGLLSLTAKSYSVYFFSLYILPIAAAAFALNMFNSLIIAVFASLFVAGNLLLNTQAFPGSNEIYLGAFQIVFLLLLTFFTRALALELRSEKQERTTAQSKLHQIDEKLDDLEAIEEEFVALTTHQLNTPLSIIRGYSSMLLKGDGGKLTAKQKRYVNEINNGSIRLAKLIKELLDITHIERDEMAKDLHPTNLVDIVKDSVATMMPRALDRQVALNFITSKESFSIMANNTLILQVINNLIDNAIKYSDEHQEVKISLKASGNEAVSLLVADKGIGIPTEEHARIFQRFYRATNSVDKDSQGTGLGLYIVKRIVEEHGGTISFASRQNKGTAFTISLPLASQTEA